MGLGLRSSIHTYKCYFYDNVGNLTMNKFKNFVGADCSKWVQVLRSRSHH
jgi:hypothetical protein